MCHFVTSNSPCQHFFMNVTFCHTYKHKKMSTFTNFYQLLDLKHNCESDAHFSTKEHKTMPKGYITKPDPNRPQPTMYAIIHHKAYINTSGEFRKQFYILQSIDNDNPEKRTTIQSFDNLTDALITMSNLFKQQRSTS